MPSSAKSMYKWKGNMEERKFGIQLVCGNLDSSIGSVTRYQFGSLHNLLWFSPM